MFVVQYHGFIVVHVDRVGKAVLNLYQSDNSVVYQCYKLRTYAFAYERSLFDFKRSYALGLDEQLVGE